MIIPWDFSGRQLGRFRAWLHRTPRKGWDEASPIEKVGRVALIALVLALVAGLVTCLVT
jgi:hypothetical protein